MQLDQDSISNKNTDSLSEAFRNTSCSRGWLRILVQFMFSLITVVSFILIVLMAIQNITKRENSNQASNCLSSNCRVVCTQTPYYGNYEEDIFSAVQEAEIDCVNVSLTLNRPVFTEGKLSLNWLSRMRSNIHELIIVGGNLRHIPDYAFMTEFTRNVKTLVLEDITISLWSTDMLIGFTTLTRLIIKDCEIEYIQQNALRAVDETLETIKITYSGFWIPTNITGSSHLIKLTTVDFSMNYFGNILQSNSFSRLRFCKVLYLSSCGITAIGPDTFRPLVNVEFIYLNNNYLITIPPGLFLRFTAKPYPKPKIDLQDNFWHCDCSIHNFQLLTLSDILFPNPICYYPVTVRGMSFSNFQKYCKNYTTKKIVKEISTEIIDSTDLLKDSHSINGFNNVWLNGMCHNGEEASEHFSPKVISPIDQSKCALNTRLSFDLLSPSFNTPSKHKRNKSGLRPSFFIKNYDYSMFELSSSAIEGYGLVWYQSKCPNDVYCINTLPHFLRIYTTDTDSWYRFCPVALKSGIIENDECVDYNFVNNEYRSLFRSVLLYLITILSCLTLSGFCVYSLIRRNPSLLKGSKRVLFVKHKKLDALILPPKVPLRNSLSNTESNFDFNEKNIFVVPATQNNALQSFLRSHSIRSDRSNAPSYVSALQPTDEQLAEWRSKYHFENNSTVTPTSILSDLSGIHDQNSTYYSLYGEGEKIYESLH